MRDLTLDKTLFSKIYFERLANDGGVVSKPTELIMDALNIKYFMMQCKIVIKPSQSVKFEVIIKMKF